MFELFGSDQELYSKPVEEVKEQRDVSELKAAEDRHDALEDKLIQNKKINEAEYKVCVKDLMKDKEMMDRKVEEATGQLLDMIEKMPPEILEHIVPSIIQNILSIGIAIGERKATLRLIGEKFGYNPRNA